MRNWLIRKLGGIPLGRTDEERTVALTQAIAKNLNIITDNDILRETEQGLMWAGKLMPRQQAQALSNDAKTFKGTFLFKVLDADLQYHCVRKMKESTSLLSLEGAKCIGFMWDILKTRLNRL